MPKALSDSELLALANLFQYKVGVKLKCRYLRRPGTKLIITTMEQRMDKRNGLPKFVDTFDVAKRLGRGLIEFGVWRSSPITFRKQFRPQDRLGYHHAKFHLAKKHEDVNSFKIVLI